MRWYCGIGFYFFGAIINEHKHDDKAVYAKWLGPEFKINYDTPCSTILCNHTGWFEVQYLMYKIAPGFVSKLGNRSIPFVGQIADYLDSLWLDRSNNKSKEEVSQELKKRQEAFNEGKILSPIMVFPEGVTTSGYHILRLRKGAFETLHPLKCFLITSVGTDIGEGILPMPLKAYQSFANLYHNVKVVELPVIYPTDYMFENYSKLHPEIKGKAEIYAEVVREIWCEIGGFEKSQKGFNEYVEYLSYVKGQKVHMT